MSTTTTNYGLIKPESGEPVTAADEQSNLDMIDQELKKANDGIGNLPEWINDGTKPTTQQASQVTVATSAWSNKAANISVAGVTADNIVHMGYEGSQSNWDICKNAEIRMTAQGANRISLACANTPTGSVTLNFAIYS